MRWRLFAALVGIAASAFGAAEPARGPRSEDEPFLPAATLAQPSLLSGPNFRVAPEVQLRGYMANYLIDTRFGPLHAESTELLAVRVSEIPALEALDRASKSDAFAHALAVSGRKTGTAIVHVIAHPIDTITGLPAGVVRYFGAKIQTWTGRAQSAADRSAREFGNKGDPYRAPDGPMTAGRDAPPDENAPHEKKDRSVYGRVGAEVGREAKRYLKYSAQKREMAKVLGIDPNT
ncbi:MAG TPA: hypothetical protein VF132_04840, partial [Rudaea sp.]